GAGPHWDPPGGGGTLCRRPRRGVAFREPLRIDPNSERDEQPRQREERRPEPRPGERVRRQRPVREQRPEDQRAEDRAGDGREEHERHAARAPLGREHLGRRRPRQEDDRLRRTAAGEPEEDELPRQGPAAEGCQRRPDDAERVAAADDGHPADAVGEPARWPDGQRPGDEEDRGPEPEDALDAGDGDDRDRPQSNGELDHPRQADEPRREQDRVPARRAHESKHSSPCRNAVAPPCDGWRTYVPPRASCATRPTATIRRQPESSGANETPAAISARFGRRLERASPGCVGTAFQSSTSSSQPRSASTPWTTVAVASAGPSPVSWRSEVSGMPDTRVPRYPGASPTTSTAALARSSR